MRRAALVLALALLSLATAPGAAAAAPKVQHLSYRYGPLTITPGQNTISLDGDKVPRPKVPGYIVGFRPNLVRVKGGVPRVDVLHLHHAVWLINGQPTFAAGEEKTQVSLPRPYGWRHDPADAWVLNHMVHNLLPNRDRVYLTYDIDFVPDSSPLARGMRTVQTRWLDVEGGSAYPVFDVHRGSGRGGRFTYPDQAPNAYGDGPARNRWVVQRDGVLVQTAGHLHPGGLYSDLNVTRDGKTVRLFRSTAKYFEPAGAVSWDVAMTGTPPDWRVGVRKGDVLSVSATYDTREASWYESMGIMPVAFNAGGSGPDPFEVDVNVPGQVTHGHLDENRNHGGAFGGLPDARRLLAAPPPPGRTVPVRGFLYGRGDLGITGRAGRPPTLRSGRRLRFVNRDARRNVFHTITSCRAPCNRATGIAYPLADGPVRFDSGNLGYGPEGLTAAAQRISWKTPRKLRAGTYTYFCRVHPFMRGAFEVKPRS